MNDTSWKRVTHNHSQFETLRLSIEFSQILKHFGAKMS